MRFNEWQSELMPFTKTHHRPTAQHTAIVCCSGSEIEIRRTQFVAFCQTYGLLQTGPPRWRHQQVLCRHHGAWPEMSSSTCSWVLWHLTVWYRCINRTLTLVIDTLTVAWWKYKVFTWIVHSRIGSNCNRMNAATFEVLPDVNISASSRTNYSTNSRLTA